MSTPIIDPLLSAEQILLAHMTDGKPMSLEVMGLLLAQVRCAKLEQLHGETRCPHHSQLTGKETELRIAVRKARQWLADRQSFTAADVVDVCVALMVVNRKQEAQRHEA